MLSTAKNQAEHFAGQINSRVRVRPIHRLMANSSVVFPASKAFTNYCGLRPRPDQVSAGFSGCRYFAAAGAREDFVSVPTSSARE